MVSGFVLGNRKARGEMEKWHFTTSQLEGRGPWNTEGEGGEGVLLRPGKPRNPLVLRRSPAALSKSGQGLHPRPVAPGETRWEFSNKALEKAICSQENPNK